MTVRHNSGSSEGYEGLVNAKPPASIVMSAYDALPPRVREAVSEARLDWDVCAIRARMSAGAIDERGVLRLIADFEAHVGANVERARRA